VTDAKRFATYAHHLSAAKLMRTCYLTVGAHYPGRQKTTKSKTLSFCQAESGALQRKPPTSFATRGSSKHAAQSVYLIQCRVIEYVNSALANQLDATMIRRLCQFKKLVRVANRSRHRLVSRRYSLQVFQDIPRKLCLPAAQLQRSLIRFDRPMSHDGSEITTAPISAGYGP